MRHSGTLARSVRRGVVVAVRVAALAVLTVLATLGVTALLPQALGWQSRVVMTGSMRPAIEPGDVVVAAPLGEAAPRPGQVILVRDPADPHRLLVHRVVRVQDDGSVVTRGDANRSADSTPVPRADIVGLPRLLVPAVGLPAVWLADGDHAALVVAGVGLAVLVFAAGRWRWWVRLPKHSRGRSRGRGPLGSAAVLPVVLVAVLIGASQAVFTATTLNANNTFTSSTNFTLYQNAVGADSPTWYFRLNDSGGVVLTNSGSGSGSGSVQGISAPFSFPGAVPGDNAVGFPIGTNAVDGTTVSWNSGSSTNGVNQTIELWYRTTSAGNLADLQPQTGGVTNPLPRLYIDASNGLCYTLTSSNYNVVGTTPFSQCNNDTTLTDGRWHYLALVYDSTAGDTLYWSHWVSGSEQLTSQARTDVRGLGAVNASYWRIGSDPAVNSPTSFLGDLDEFAVYSTALSAATVSAHFSAGANYATQVSASSPYLWWRLDQSAATNPVADSSSGGNHTGAYSSWPAANYTFGQTGAVTGGGAVASAGSANQYLASPSDSSIVDSTEEIWIKVPSGGGGEIAGLYNGSVADRVIWLAGGNLYFGIYDTASTTQTIGTTGQNYADNTWHLVAASIGTAGMKLYVDGTLVASNPSYVSANHSIGTWQFGGGTLAGWAPRPTSDFLAGTLAEAAVYHAQLTDARIAAHYAAR